MVQLSDVIKTNKKEIKKEREREAKKKKKEKNKKRGDTVTGWFAGKVVKSCSYLFSKGKSSHSTAGISKEIILVHIIKKRRRRKEEKKRIILIK